MPPATAVNSAAARPIPPPFIRVGSWLACVPVLLCRLPYLGTKLRPASLTLFDWWNAQRNFLRTILAAERATALIEISEERCHMASSFCQGGECRKCRPDQAA